MVQENQVPGCNASVQLQHNYYSSTTVSFHAEFMFTVAAQQSQVQWMLRWALSARLCSGLPGVLKSWGAYSGVCAPTHPSSTAAGTLSTCQPSSAIAIFPIVNISPLHLQSEPVQVITARLFFFGVLFYIGLSSFIRAVAYGEETPVRRAAEE